MYAAVLSSCAMRNVLVDGSTRPRGLPHAHYRNGTTGKHEETVAVHLAGDPPSGSPVGTAHGNMRAGVLQVVPPARGPHPRPSTE